MPDLQQTSITGDDLPAKNWKGGYNEALDQVTTLINKYREELKDE